MTTFVDVLLPDIGSGDKTDGAIVSFWLAEAGAVLQPGDDLLEIVTDKASFVVPCPQAGILHEKHVREDDRVSAGDVIAVIEVKT